MNRNESVADLQAELLRLQKENDRLKAILDKHGISYEVDSVSESNAPMSPAHQLTAADKISIFRRLFRGRNDVYAQRWESAKGKSGYSPACANEWKTGVCYKPRVKCNECSQRQLQPLTEQVIFDHLSGKCTVGIYPLFKNDECCFLAIDFDGADWQDDAKAFMQSCRELDIPSALEISRSGNGAHVWIFFSEPVSARDARQLGSALISHTCDRTRQLSLNSYDRLFPNQDTMPQGGFGNLIALPLQKEPRESGCSVFVDVDLTPHNDQWSFLNAIKCFSRAELESAIIRISGGKSVLDVDDFADDESEPWIRPKKQSVKISGELPESLILVHANQIFIEKAVLPQQLANRLIRLAAFPNPEFYKAQAMRLPVWGKPRIVGCADDYPKHIGLPRGCLDKIVNLLEDNDVRPDIKDERIKGRRLPVKFLGSLRGDQKKAVKEMLVYDSGVLCAPTAFGKTVTAAAIIARRKVNTLVLVHRVELLRQWKERLKQFLDIPKEMLGNIGGGKTKPSGKIDIAVMQSIVRREDMGELLDKYGQIIVDECHHISAFSFESILKQAKSKYVLGLTATPVRRDGHHPIIFMQCGSIRHTARRPESSLVKLEVKLKQLSTTGIPEEDQIQDIFRLLVQNDNRNQQIAADIMAAYKEGRKILVLTERTEHLQLLLEKFDSSLENLFVLHGRISKKQRMEIYKKLNSIDAAAPRIIFATGRLIGEGFDHPPLDTLVLAMPISWKGTLQQYAGRLHREHADKHDFRIYDYVEQNQPKLARMWEKRKRGYQIMGYAIY